MNERGQISYARLLVNLFIAILGIIFQRAISGLWLKDEKYYED